ncbi:MAG: hypothetical protein WCT77_05130 [Bacteroidota bacterium]
MEIEFVTVINNFDIYNRIFINNSFLSNFKLVKFDNTTENLPLAKRYNQYIDKLMPENTWIVFCHQDFEFKEDISTLLQNLDYSNIYGPIGAGWKKNLVCFLRLDYFKIRKFKIGIIKRRQIIGSIEEKQSDKYVKIGKFIKRPEIVDTVDGCCIIIHSSLIKKYNLRFDDNLDWHLYSEDFSLNAKIYHKVITKVVQISSTHHSSGSFNAEFHHSLVYIRNKYNNFDFASTCYDGYNYNFVNKL